MDLLVSLLFAVIVFGLIVWIVQQIPMPAPFKQIANIILGLIILLWLFDGFHIGHLRYLH